MFAPILSLKNERAKKQQRFPLCLFLALAVQPHRASICSWFAHPCNCPNPWSSWRMSGVISRRIWGFVWAFYMIPFVFNCIFLFPRLSFDFVFCLESCSEFCSSFKNKYVYDLNGGREEGIMHLKADGCIIWRKEGNLTEGKAEGGWQRGGREWEGSWWHVYMDLIMKAIVLHPDVEK